MSGHSKWSNIKNRKGAQDAKRGKIFSKLSRLITLAVKEGNSPDISANPRLRMAVDRAKSENMPKDNIDRAIENAIKKKEAIEEFTLEGYGPQGVAVLIEVLTDNRQRTIQEVKNIFSKNGGSLTEPGAVAFQFEKKGVIELSDPSDETKTLELIDLGIEDFSQEGGKLILLVDPVQVGDFVQKLKEKNFNVLNYNIILEPKTTVTISDEKKANELLNFLDLLDDHDDVQQVSANLDIPEEIAKKVS